MVEQLSYIGFTSPKAAAWREFSATVLGAELTAASSAEAVRLRLDDAAWRIAVHPGERDGLAYFSWATAGPPAFEAALARLAAQGVKVHAADPSLTAEREVAALAWFVDPLGFRHELSWGLRHRPSSFRAARAMRGFVTGAGA